MKAIFKIFALLFGLSQANQSSQKSYLIQKIEKDAELMAERMVSENYRTVTRTVTGNVSYSEKGSGLSKAEFARFMYNSKRVICL